MENNMELRLIDTKNFNKNNIKLSTREHYEIGDYNVVVDTFEDGFTKICTRQKGNIKYLPSISELRNFDKDGVLYGFEIGTTSYGKTMMVDDIKEVVKGFEYAIKVVEILTEKFVNK
jgi:hypothetical protein